MEDIQIVDIELESILGTEAVAQELGKDYRDALVLMKNGVIPSIRVNGWITLRPVLDKNRYKITRQS